ncbi:MAG: Arc family DNA binding domain-containing protein [Nanoarchaeota archaeon]|nr:Arc family DNA binding domain-containing protein [Nanoarchaeota archaeon]
MAKKILSVTIDEKLLSQWKKYAEEEYINTSKLLENMIKEHLKKRGIIK